MTYVLAHGWGFSPGFWDRMAVHLPACERLDFGFFGPPDLDWPAETFTLIGHSFGAFWGLLEVPPHCAGVVAICGFARFPGGRPLDRMIARFDDEPEAVLAAFQQRSGAPADTAGLQAARLKRALLRLRDESASRAPALAIHGAADPWLRRSDFAGAHVLDGGHLLPLTHAAECAALISSMK